MDSPQSVVSPFKSSSIYAEDERQNVVSPDCLSKGTEVQKKEASICNFQNSIGFLEVFVHQARDIHNICIYHKQDVYAKLCLTSDPENTVSTQTINGGGQNPVFNQNLRINVRTTDSSLKCEIWMLSRVKNYLEDQLLGFALVPLSEVLIKNGKLEKEFPLSSTDLFHSPAGFVQLSISYSGTSPEVIVIPVPVTSVTSNAIVHGSGVSESTIPSELGKIEFPDPKIANENHMMVSEYFGISCTNLESQSSESLLSSDIENQMNSELGVRLVESFSTDTADSIQVLLKRESPPSSVSTNGSPSHSLPISSQSCDTPTASKPPNQEFVSPLKEKREEAGDAESDVSSGLPENTIVKPIVNVNIEPEQKVVQQEIVDMYMKSMQQFTESLAKMKLPMDFETGPTSSGNSSSEQNLPASKNNNGSRVFYGSRAFF